MSDQSDETREQNNEMPGSSTGEAWEAVGKSFQVLGESLAQAFRSAFDNDENRTHIEKMQSRVEEIFSEVGQAIKDNVNSPQVQQIQDEAAKAVRSLRDTGEASVQEIRPHVLSALRRMNEEIQRVIDDLEKNEPGSDQQI